MVLGGGRIGARWVPVAAAVVLIAVATVAILVASGSSGEERRAGSQASTPRASSEPAGASRITTGTFEPSARARPPLLRPGAPIVLAGRTVHRVAADEHHLVFEVGPHEEERGDGVLLQRDLRDDRTTTLARDVAHDRGLASTAGWVVYAEAAGGTRLMAIAHDRSKRIVLSRSLVAPIAARGEIVAWAEEEHGHQRVIVRDTASGVEWLAADLPRCEQGSCYRVDQITLADRGVVFTRAASGPDTSRVVRRAGTRTSAR